MWAQLRRYLLQRIEMQEVSRAVLALVEGLQSASHM